MSLKRVSQRFIVTSATPAQVGELVGVLLAYGCGPKTVPMDIVWEG